MVEMVRYEEMAVKAVASFVVAMCVVLCGLLMLGIELMTCNFAVLVGGIAIVTLLIWVCSLLKS